MLVYSHGPNEAESVNQRRKYVDRSRGPSDAITGFADGKGQ